MVSCMLMTPNQLIKCILDFRVPDTSAKLKSINGTNDGYLRELLLSSSPIISWEILLFPNFILWQMLAERNFMNLISLTLFLKVNRLKSHLFAYVLPTEIN